MHGSLFFYTFAPLITTTPKLQTKIVYQIDSPFSNAQILAGLAAADSQSLQFIFTEIRPSISKAVQSIGGSSADGNVFFQAALIDLAHLMRNNNVPENIEIKDALTTLAKQHYISWNNRNTDAPPPDPEAAPNEPEWLPNESEFKNTRQHIYVWKSLNKLSSGCKATLLETPVEEETTCKTELAIALHPPKSNTPPDTTLPDYAQAALNRKTDYSIWTTIRKYEENIEQGLSIDGKAPKTDTTIAKYAFITALFMTLGYAIFNYFNSPKPAEEIFKQNFEPPQSLLADMNKRFENDTSGIVKPERCTEIFAQADQFYSQKNYAAARDLILEIPDNESLETCRSDAFFALGIISLKREDPGDALQFLAKIENIEAYGEDLYWYQALAFVQLAKRSTNYRAVARGAMERFLENTRNDERRKQGETMLNELQ